MLDASPDYRVLRKFVERDVYRTPMPAIGERRYGLFVDTETTSKNSADALIVELAAVEFMYDDAGTIYSIYGHGDWLEDPGTLIPAEATAVHGITDADVMGHRIEDHAVDLWLRSINLVVAHNAAYDRPILERRLPVFAGKAFACSWRDVPWAERFGCSSGKLVHVLQDTHREFYDAHRALIDCRVGVHVLTATDEDGRTALSYLLEAALQKTTRCYAEGAPFSVKDGLKAREYRWDAVGRVWWKDVPTEAVDDERAWLATHAATRRPRCVEITARERYSGRIA